MSRESLSLTFRGLPVHFSIVRPEAHLRHRLLFLCSPLLTGFHWRKLLPELSELGCLCVLAELPGFGQGAAAYAHPHDSATRARLIWGVLDEVDARVGGQNALWHLAAHGCACSTVMAMSAAQPDSVQSLIEISPLIPAGGRGRFCACWSARTRCRRSAVSAPPWPFGAAAIRSCPPTSANSSRPCNPKWRRTSSARRAISPWRRTAAPCAIICAAGSNTWAEVLAFLAKTVYNRIKRWIRR